MEENQREENSFDFIELQNIANDPQKDYTYLSKSNVPNKLQKNKSSSATKKASKGLSSTCQESNIDSANPRNANYFQEFKKEIKSMSYSDRIKSFFSNATYNMKTLSKSSWKSVKVNSKHRQVRLFDKVFTYDEKNPEHANTEFNYYHERVIWFSYRNNFPLIRDVMNESDSASNDYGWGCMIRCSQMLLAEALQRHYRMEFDFLNARCSIEDQKEFYKRILKLFLDCTSEMQDNVNANQLNELCLEKQLKDSQEINANNVYSIFGIQNICKNAINKQYQQSVKNWYTSIQVSVLLQEILEDQQRFLNFKTGFHIINFTDQIIFLKELTEATQTNNILVMVHLKFGINKFELQYKDYLMGLLNISSFVGALSGTETKGMYIVGHSEDRLIFLDPHFIQESTTGEEGLDKDYHTYFNKTPRSLSLECLSSDISLGFFIDISKKDSKDRFIDEIFSLNEHFEDPLLSVLQDRVDIEIDEEMNEEGDIKNKQDSQANSKNNKEDFDLSEEREDQKEQEIQVQQQQHPYLRYPKEQNQEEVNPEKNLYYDIHISNGSTLSDTHFSNFENNSYGYSNFKGEGLSSSPQVLNLQKKKSDKIMIDNNSNNNALQVGNQIAGDQQSKPEQKKVLYNDFEVIS